MYFYLHYIGLIRHHKDKHYPVLLFVSHIDEMNGIVAMETGITFGAAVTLTEIEDCIQDFIDQHVNGIRRTFHIVESHFYFSAIITSPLLDIS